jgi:hypothetical protein
MDHDLAPPAPGGYRCSCGRLITPTFCGSEEDWARLDARHRDLLAAMALACHDAAPGVPIRRTVAVEPCAHAPAA